MKTNSFWFLTRSDVQSKKQTRILKFRIYQEGGLYDLSSENKGADKLCSYCEADLRLYLSIYLSSDTESINF